MTARIVVTDAQEHAVLAMIRCLATTGSRVTAVAATHAAPGLWSQASAAPPGGAGSAGFG